MTTANGSAEPVYGLHQDVTEKIIGCFFSVANELGTGFLESVYRRALCIVLREHGLRVQEECAIPVIFHGQNIGIFRADIIVEDRVILELKVAEDITGAFEAQLLHYLRASHLEVGLILAFGSRAKHRRKLLTNVSKRPRPTNIPL